MAVVQSAVERTFDTHAVARAVLAGHANGASKSQFERFRSALVGRIVRDSMKRLRSGGRGTLDIVRTRAIASDEWLVSTQLQVKAKGPQSISWRVRTGPGGARISDVLGSGTSMVRVLRNNYAGAIQKLGLDGVTTRIEARNRARD